MISCSSCSATPVFVFTYNSDSDTFRFLCGYCIGEALSSSSKDEILKLMSIKCLEEKLNELIMNSQKEFSALEKSKKILEKNSKNSDASKLAKEKKELQDLANNYYELANSLQEQAVTLKSKVSFNGENSRQLSYSALHSLSSFETKLVKIQEIKAKNNVEELLHHYEQLKTSSHSAIVKQALKESKVNEGPINLRLANTQLREQIESVSICIKGIDKFFNQYLGEKHDDLSVGIPQSQTKSEIEMNGDKNWALLQEKVKPAMNKTQNQSPSPNSNSNLKSYKYAIYLNSLYILKCFNTMQQRFYEPKDIKSNFMQISSYLCSDFRYVNTGNGIFICGGGIQKGETVKDCFILEVDQSTTELNIKIEAYPQMQFSRKRHNIAHIKTENHLGNPIGMIFCLSGLRTNKCEFTVLNDDKSDKSWRQLPSLNRVRSNASTLVVNNIVYIYGGFDTDFEGNYHNSFESFPVQDAFKSARETKWTLIEFKTQNLNKSAFSSIIKNDETSQAVYIVGGFNGTNCDHYFKAEVFQDKEWKITEEEQPFPRKCLFLNQDFKLGYDCKLYAFDFSGTLFSFDSVINILSESNS